MNKYLVYHGTPYDNIEKIINNNFYISQGDQHWLGNGVYFYPEKFYAYKWNQNRINKMNRSGIEEKQGILEVEIECEVDKIFDLDTLEHKIILKKIIERIKNFTSEDIEGTAINILFNELNYDEKFNMIIATFALRRYVMKLPKERLDFLPEKQICVKNLKCIVNLKEVEFTKEEIEKFDHFIGELAKPIKFNIQKEEAKYNIKRKVIFNKR